MDTCATAPPYPLLGDADDEERDEHCLPLAEADGAAEASQSTITGAPRVTGRTVNRNVRVRKTSNDGDTNLAVGGQLIPLRAPLFTATTDREVFGQWRAQPEDRVVTSLIGRYGRGGRCGMASAWRYTSPHRERPDGGRW